MKKDFSNTKKLFLVGAFLLIGGLGLVVSMQSFGKSAPQDKMAYIEGNILYVSGINEGATPLLDGVGRLAGQSPSGEILLIGAVGGDARVGGSGKISGSELKVFDPQSGKERVIAQNIWVAQFSPDGRKIITADSDNQIRLFDIDGTQKARIGKNGSQPIFSHDGKYVVYQKLADAGNDFFDLAEHAQGLALYDLSTGKERMLTDKSGDDFPIGFSADGKYFYFSAGRPYETTPKGFVNIEVSLYSLNIETGAVRRLTNVDEEKVLRGERTMSMIDRNAIWTSDRLKAITTIGRYGVYQYTFDGKGGLVSVDLLTEGDFTNGAQPRWVEQDKRFAVHEAISPQGYWKIIDVK